MRAILIAGPTASGKSALALALARQLDGIIINADSMQVYRDLRIITARPSPDEEAIAPHRLYGHLDAAVNYSVGQWCRDVADVLLEARADGKTAIIVGGTGLYFKALTTGLSSVPATPPDIRTAVRARIASEGAAALHAELSQRDPPTAARLMVNDRSRIGRALEVLEATGRSLSDWHREGKAWRLPPLVDPAQAVKVFLTVERAPLVARIEARFAAMLAAGALAEVEALAARGLDPLLPAMKAHGVPWLLRHLRGELALAAASAAAVMDTRRYAKRQVTWFRNQMPGWTSARPDAAEQAVLAAISVLPRLKAVPDA